MNAAPDLLAALSDLLPIAVKGAQYLAPDAEGDKVFQRAYEAIAKATTPTS